MEELFIITTTNSIDEGKLNLATNYSLDYIEFVGRTRINNGVKGYLKRLSIKPNLPNVISVSQIGTIVAQLRNNLWYASQNIFTLFPKNGNNKLISLGNLAAINKSLQGKFSDGYANYPTLETLRLLTIQLPTQNGEIDFEFMENFIAELEAERIAELEAYLTVTGLKDYTLTEEEKRALENIEKTTWNDYRIGEMFEKVALNIKNANFNKKKDLSDCCDEEHTIPITNAKFGDNGIMFWAKKEDFETTSMSIDIVQNGAVATGKVYPQPQETSVLWDSYLVKLKNSHPTREMLFFLTTAIEKSIRQKYCYEYKAYWNKVQNDYILLPSKDNLPDFAFMQTFISAIQKLVIKDVVLYADKKIAATKAVVEKK